MYPEGNMPPEFTNNWKWEESLLICCNKIGESLSWGMSAAALFPNYNVNTDIQLCTLNSQCRNCKQHPPIKVTNTTKTFNFNPNFYITIMCLCGVCVWPHVCTQRPEADCASSSVTFYFNVWAFSQWIWRLSDHWAGRTHTFQVLIAGVTV